MLSCKRWLFTNEESTSAKLLIKAHTHLYTILRQYSSCSKPGPICGDRTPVSVWQKYVELRKTDLKCEGSAYPRTHSITKTRHIYRYLCRRHIVENNTMANAVFQIKSLVQAVMSNIAWYNVWWRSSAGLIHCTHHVWMNQSLYN